MKASSARGMNGSSGGIGRRGALKGLAGGLAGGMAAFSLGRAGGAVRARASGAQADGPEPTREVQAPAADPNSSPTLAAAVNQFTTMTATRYSHQYAENAAAGTYIYDCVGFTTYTLGLATPNAYASLYADLRIKKGYVPSPPHYVQFFSVLEQQAFAGWQAVTRVADIQPGDFVDWNLEANNPNATATGHAIIAAGPPLLLADGSYALLVYDSTATPHGPYDTRHTDSRCEIGANGFPSGLGRGTLQFHIDAKGAPEAVSWTVGTKRTVAPMAIGRPLN